MDDEMLEAHVQFELTAWTQEFNETITWQVQAVFDWLEGVSVGSVFSEADLTALIAAIPVPDLTESVLAAHRGALVDESPIEDVVRREDYDRVATALGSMTALHEAIIEQVTTSEVYADLISHVLLHGIQNYVTTESPIARVPGASSLMRFGQSAFDTAAPRLSKGIEKQLTAFVSANLQDTLRESRQFLSTVIDEESVGEVGEEFWERNATKTVAEAAEVLTEDSLVDLSTVARDALAHLLGTETFHQAARSVLDANAARTVADVLAEADVTVDNVATHIRPWVLRAADDGLLETLIRQRLTAFYETYV
jgi:hypothetical protein